MPGDAFLYLGTTEKEQPLAVPYPTVGGAAFDVEVPVVTLETASGRLVGQQRGKPRVAQAVGWDSISAADWWTLRRWFEENGPFCYVKYFSHSVGTWRIEQFLCTQFTCSPILVDANGAPEYYENAKFVLQSTGG